MATEPEEAWCCFSLKKRRDCAPLTSSGEQECSRPEKIIAVDFPAMGHALPHKKNTWKIGFEPFLTYK
jgi:hypothetical protein